MNVELETALTETYDRLVAAANRLTRRYREKVIKPFCLRRNWSFYSENGNWGFCDAEGEVLEPEDLEEEDPEWEDVLDTLSFPIPGTDTNVGAWTPPFRCHHIESDF